ncbi:MAG: antibiotic biosynthesis monooxygenase [Moritella sp.]|uniref:putative quinol monooxygenase n=1 Tax=Moritella sp. TaxID=78556 RepID=UPI0025E97A3A|nr:putative quinol monooxygenase [Moritella sp.]NQZ92670.1 antibiotic biosynthesis monooxygenase [Moritella sp.]
MICVTAEFIAQTGSENQLEQLLTSMLEPSRQEDGCISYQLQRTEDKSIYLFQERFVDQAAFDFHCEQDYFKALIENVGNLIIAEPKIQFYIPVELK